MRVRRAGDLGPDRMPGAFGSVAHSDRGSVRPVNEDSFLDRFPVFVVADGMGGHAHGDRASRAAVAAFEAELPAASVPSPESVLAAIRRANADVVALQVPGDSRRVLAGTTLAGLAFVRSETGTLHWMAFNVGDSRVYSWDGRSLVQLSVDHSVVQELLDAGSITRLEALRHPERNVVTRALGAESEVEPDVWLLPFSGHQRFILCSDGLTRELSDDEIARIIVFHDSEPEAAADAPPTTLAARLVGAAVAAGGADNVTVLVVESRATGVESAPGDTLDRASDRGLLGAGVVEETMPRSPA